MVDRITKSWIRNPSDELAVKNGCKFDVLRGAHVVWWIERYCRLYEGAEGPLLLNGCHDCGPYDLPDLTESSEWDETTQEICIERAKRHASCVKKGHRIDWQYDCTMRVFGWVKLSTKLKRWIRRFRESSIFVAKKNKKSPTLASWAMYMLCGDGEQGQKVYLCAKDGSQARDIAGGHVVKMVEKSTELSVECVINKNLCRVTHVATDSWMQPLSSANERTQKSKEGLNGSCFVDEVHVVDRAFINRINRAGISRDEPLHAEFSTSGDDVDSYGFGRFELAVKVESGEVEHQGLFAAVFAAPQNLSDADLAKDPLKYGYMANPAMGHTVDPDEYMDDYRRSQQSPAELAIFKMYRLDVWQNAASPWLDMVKWKAGERDIKLEDYYGRRCWSSLDLASVKDFCALTLCFPKEGGVYVFFWWFWLPEETAQKYGNLIPIKKWLADDRCNLMLTPGARADYGFIESKYRELAELFDIQQLLYDDWNAEQVTQEISEGVRDHTGRQVIPGTGIPRINFSQGIKTMNEPTKRFEILVLDEKCQHDGNPLATWMAANTTVKPDANGNYKPIKPREGVKKIDGTVTAVMAHAGAENGDSGRSYYEDHDFDDYG